MTGPRAVRARVPPVWPGFIVTYGTGRSTATLISATSSIAATVSVVAREVMRSSLSPARAGTAPWGRPRRRPDRDAAWPVVRLDDDPAGRRRERFRERRADPGRTGRLVAVAVVALSTGPRRPDHRESRDPQRDREPPQHTHVDQRRRLSPVWPELSSVCRAIAPMAPDNSAGSRRADPLVGAVAEALMLPDRDRRLELVDQRMAGVESLAAMRRAHSDHDRDVTDGELTDPMHRGDPNDAIARRHLLGDLAHPVERGRVSGVRQPLHRAAAVVVTHRTHEHRQATGPRVGQGTVDLVDAQRLLAEGEFPNRVSHE